MLISRSANYRKKNWEEKDVVVIYRQDKITGNDRRVHVGAVVSL